MALLEKLTADETGVDPQSKSLLFKLPLEVRTEIYQNVYPEHLLHLRENFNALKRNLPYCRANWCVAINDYAKGYTHDPCQWFDMPRKQLLGMPSSCRRLYLETIQSVYGRHTMQFRGEDFMLEWQRRTPQIHVDAITSVQLTGLAVTLPLSDDFQNVWEMLSRLPNLQSLAAKISGCETDDNWGPAIQEEISAPMKRVQQRSIQSYDVIFEIGDTWFPDDYYIRISYNKLHWSTFSFDKPKFPAFFDGLHPRCRVVGMNGFIFNQPVHDDMPTQEHLCNWMSWFCCHAAYGAIYPPDYDCDEVGEKYAAAAAFASENSEREEELKEQASEERSKLERQYLLDEDGPEADPIGWDLDAINRFTEMLDSGYDAWPRTGRWHYPEKPSWIENGSLEKPHEFPPMHFGGHATDDDSESNEPSD